MIIVEPRRRHQRVDSSGEEPRGETERSKQSFAKPAAFRDTAIQSSPAAPNKGSRVTVAPGLVPEALSESIPKSWMVEEEALLKGKSGEEREHHEEQPDERWLEGSDAHGPPRTPSPIVSDSGSDREFQSEDVTGFEIAPGVRELESIDELSANKVEDTFPASHHMINESGEASRPKSIPQQTDSGYASMERSERQCRDDENYGGADSDSLHLLSSEIEQPLPKRTPRRYRPSEDPISGDPDAIQHVTPDYEDIGSRKPTSKTRGIVAAENHLKACILSNQNILTLLTQIALTVDVEDLRIDIRELLKHYHLDLRRCAGTNLEKATADLLRSHWYRDKIARRIAFRLKGLGEENEESEDDESRENKGMSRADINA